MSEKRFDARPGHGTPIDLKKLRSLQVKGDQSRTYTPGWTVREPDGHIVDQCDGPVAAEMHMASEMGG